MAKGLLLLRDFAKYQSILRSRYGHNLVLLVSDALSEFKLNSLRPALLAELQELDQMYEANVLRYDFLNRLLIGPKTISSELVLKRVVAILRLVHREMEKAFPKAA